MKKYTPPSKIAARTYAALKLTGFTIVTEFSVGERLRGDFLIRELACVIEVDGDQHEVMNPFFHDGKDAFRNSKKRDNRKEVLCQEQGLKLVRLSAKEVMAAKDAQELVKLILAKLAGVETVEEW